MGHPAHVHFFRNTIKDLENNGHEVKITARNKDVTLKLLEAYGFEYEMLGEHYGNILNKIYGMIRIDFNLYKISKSFKPDILIGIHNPYTAQIGKMIGKPSITFTDTEDVKIGSAATYPFTNVICTPSCFKKQLNIKKHIKYNGYHELAYLHPNQFKPDPSVLENLNLSKNDRYIIVRLISWKASHDLGLSGIKSGSEVEFFESLEQYGQVFITSERNLSSSLEKYRITSPPEKMHSLLYYSQLYIGEGGTMAVESALLGTPAIHIESTSSGIATGEQSGNFLELRDKYDLLYMYPDQKQALEKAIEILEDKGSKNKWAQKIKKLFNDKIDVAEWMTDFIERYPESFYESI